MIQLLPDSGFYELSGLSELNVRIIALAGRLTHWAYGRMLVSEDSSGLAFMLSALFLALGQLTLTEGFWMQLFFLLVSTTILILAIGLVLALFLVLVWKLSKRATMMGRLFRKSTRKFT